MMRFRGLVSGLIIVLTLALLNVPSITPTRAQGGDIAPLAPQGENGKTYYAPFPVKITVDGDLADWAGVPSVTVKASSGDAAVTFAAAADDQFLYMYGDVLDDKVISGEHGTDYWNEDSLEFYINGTGDLTLSRYQDGIVQITIPPLNAGKTGDEIVISGINGAKAGAVPIVKLTDTGYVVEMSVPLHNDIWDIEPTHEGEIGFNVNVNVAAQTNRSTKINWSFNDMGDQSYQNAQAFGKLIFFEVGKEVVAAPTATDEGDAFVVDTSVGWDTRKWELTWSDEFEGDAGTPVNPANWTPNIGGDGWGNNELEYFTGRTENASLDGNGNLAIVARKENPANYKCHYGTCEFTSARLMTKNKVEFTYGRIEGRIQIPRGQGMWPAFWLLGSNVDSTPWPACGEIDIMENVGFEPNIARGTLHGPGYSGSQGIGGPYEIDGEFADDFHVFAIDWDPNVIRWYVDSNLTKTVSINDVNGRDWVFDHDFFIILNIAVGGYWPGNPDKTTEFPQTMLIDYVRVYKLAE